MQAQQRSGQVLRDNEPGTTQFGNSLPHAREQGEPGQRRNCWRSSVTRNGHDHDISARREVIICRGNLDSHVGVGCGFSYWRKLVSG